MKDDRRTTRSHGARTFTGKQWVLNLSQQSAQVLQYRKVKSWWQDAAHHAKQQAQHLQVNSECCKLCTSAGNKQISIRFVKMCYSNTVFEGIHKKNNSKHYYIHSMNVSQLFKKKMDKFKIRHTNVSYFPIIKKTTTSLNKCSPPSFTKKKSTNEFKRQ